MCHLSRVAAMSLMVALAVSLPARALAQALTESEAVARAMAENARLRAARARPAQVAAEQRIRRLAPNPVVSFLQEDAAGTRDSFVLVQQELPTSGRLGLLKQAGTAARERGFALARHMLDWARSELAGAYLIPPFKRYEEIVEIFT